MNEIVAEFVFSYTIDGPYKLVGVKKNGKILSFDLMSKNGNSDEITTVDVEFNPYRTSYFNEDFLVESHQRMRQMRIDQSLMKDYWLWGIIKMKYKKILNDLDFIVSGENEAILNRRLEEEIYSFLTSTGYDENQLLEVEIVEKNDITEYDEYKYMKTHEMEYCVTVNLVLQLDSNSIF